MVILTNSGGPGVMAADAVAEYGLELSSLREEVLSGLDEVLPPHWSRANPVDILGDAGPDRYAKAADCCFGREDMDGMLVICNPQAMTDPADVARSMARVPQGSSLSRVCGLDGRQGRGRRDRDSQPWRHTYLRHAGAGRPLFHVSLPLSKNLEMLQEIPSLLPRVVEPDEGRPGKSFRRGQRGKREF
jgi:acetyltransferase